MFGRLGGAFHFVGFADCGLQWKLNFQVHEMEVAFWAGILQGANGWFAVRLAVGSFAFANLLSQHHLEIFNTMAVINLWNWFS